MGHKIRKRCRYPCSQYPDKRTQDSIIWTSKIVGRPHKSYDCSHQIPRHSKISALFITSIALIWILFCGMKTPGSYIILVGIFYQVLIQTFSFSCNIYPNIDNMIITTHIIMMFLPYIVHILNWYFEFINPSWLLNRKRQPLPKFVEEIQKSILWTKNKN